MMEMEYQLINELPDYWKMKIEIMKICPYCNGGLMRVKKPIEHLKCIRCDRRYA